MDTIFGLLPYVIGIIVLVGVVSMVGARGRINRRKQEILHHLPVTLWRSLLEIQELVGGAKFTTRAALVVLVAEARVEARLSPVLYEHFSPEARKIAANSIRLNADNAQNFEFRAIPQPHGPRNRPDKEPGFDVESDGPLKPA